MSDEQSSSEEPCVLRDEYDNTVSNPGAPGCEGFHFPLPRDGMDPKIKPDGNKQDQPPINVSEPTEVARHESVSPLPAGGQGAGGPKSIG